MLVVQVPRGQGLQAEYLRRIVGPLAIHEELVLMLSFRQIQDGYKVVLAAEREEAAFQLGGLALASGPTMSSAVGQQMCQQFMVTISTCESHSSEQRQECPDNLLCSCARHGTPNTEGSTKGVSSEFMLFKAACRASPGAWRKGG